MESFDAIWRRAAKRHGGDEAVAVLLPEAKSPDALRAILPQGGS